MNQLTITESLAAPANRYQTHEVRNQAQPASGFNAFSNDNVLTAAIQREAPWAAERCAALGAVAGDEQVQELARLANKHNPELKTHDRFGHRIDWVEFHPSWHQLMTLAWKHEVPNLTWRTKEEGGHYARAVLSYLWNQVEQGTACPTGMAYASHAGFSVEPALAIWAQKSLGTQYQFSRSEVGDKPSVVIGYAMTEKQGGSDLRETQTTARFSHSANYHGATAHWYELTGHKWFCSVPQSDGFFTLAKVDGGVTCFFLPRTLPDGSFNRFFVQRLKDKAGNRSNASSEVEYAGTLAIRVGEEGHGIREILSHAHLTRLDFAVGSAGLMRQALTLALQHTTTRSAFGTSIAERPMMLNVLADMAVEVEAATLFALRVAKATDGMDKGNEHEKLLARIATPAAKFFNCSRAPAIANEALQCHGGNGFIEENPMARLYREAPLNSVWEGTANMMCMDVRRAMQRTPETRDALLAEWKKLAGQDARFDQLAANTERLIAAALTDEYLARPMTEAIARTIQGAELLQHSTAEVSNAFFTTRCGLMGSDWGSHFGTMGAGVGSEAAKRIVQRANVFA
ncbi:acyl-CoA dehydrogenase [Diaphorobacter sp. HDW4B]|uniref:acyl-CoA dehydrogenase family protein n=1 Tax=Diaphorobacter sp. HDW4B TaxID=2714925 RepID=UPI00140CFF97|nr:acyl-CoA dehydrogenase family protein [Diaphorobacter sp. HDW4B]QIL72084.1 acyl-CoA dehydrogenase [Diaphorobacter sp. HDW4B]